MTATTHGYRIGALMVGAAILLGNLVARTEIFFADGLRYIDQARRIDSGSLVDGLFKSIDHPAYPLAIVAAHRLKGGWLPETWASSAQLAAAVAGVLLVVPLYLLGLELFGGRSAWLGVVLFYASPLVGHVLADALSEGTFLLFWTWGLWAAVRFLRDGRFGWLPLTIVFGGLAYLCRPEGLLLPAALVATLVLVPLLRSTRMNWPRWLAAMAFLVVGPALFVLPIAAAKGGLGTKPAIARLIGTAPKSAADAVERLRPLEAGQSEAKTYALAARIVGDALRDSISWPLIPLALLGFAAARSGGATPRAWLLVGLIGAAGLAALVRLYVTGGYCSPRHALVIAEVCILAAGAGLDAILRSIKIPGRWLGLGEGPVSAGPAFWGLALLAYGAFAAPTIATPIGVGYGGYKVAGDFIGTRLPLGTRVVDVTGWALYYGERPGYTFANLVDAKADPDLRWVIAREQHLKGPWTYCQELRSLVGNLTPFETFTAPQGRGRYRVKVHIYHLPEPPARPAFAAATAPPGSPARR